MNQTLTSTKPLHLQKLAEFSNTIAERFEIARKEPFLVAVDGRGGAGKSTLVAFLKEQNPTLTVLALDDIVHPLFDRRQFKVFAKQVLEPLTKKQKGKYQKFDWVLQKHTDWREVMPQGVILIDGLGSLDQILSDYYDLTIWVDCDKDIAFQRGWERDKHIYHVNTMNEWVKEWIPKQEAYILKQNPQEKAAIIITT